jgi:pimeloyl-ACP methyl ester carboxylesterase
MGLAGAGLASAVALGCGTKDNQSNGQTGGNGGVGPLPTTRVNVIEPKGTYDSDGLKIHYEISGMGGPLLMLHGFASNSQATWEANGWLDALNPVRQVCAIDTRGHGQSDKPHDEASYGDDNLPLDAVNFLDFMTYKKMDVFGYGEGAFIAAALLARHRAACRSVILGGIGDVFAGIPAAMSKSIHDAMLASDPSTITDPVAKAYRDLAASDPNSDLAALAACAGKVGDPVKTSDYTGLDVPVLIFAGANDTVFAGAENTAQGMPGAKLTVLPGVDHFSLLSDQRFKDAAVAFLNSGGA